MVIKHPPVVIYITLLLIVLSQLSCGTFQIIVQDQLPFPASTKTTLPPTTGDTPVFTPAQPSINDVPSLTPIALSESWFSPKISFYIEPDPQKSQRIFPSGTRQIFAIWDYANMKQGNIVRREWYKDAKLFLVQEDRWDFSRYGAQGTIADITIHDFEKGLEKGLFSLRLFINGQEQTLNTLKDQSSFRIIDVNFSPPLKSPDGNLFALVPDPRSLVIQQENGQQNRVFIGQEIAGLAWFPDNQNIIVSNRDRTKQDISGTAEGIQDELWIIDTNSGLRVRIATPEENLHMPLISPEGRYVAAISGTGRLNACESDLSVVLIELDQDLTRVGIHHLNEFSGFPDYEFSPIPINHPAAPMPGVWQEQNRLSVALKYPCSSGEADGVYLFNLDTWQVDRLR